jgi:hypothetical protein
MFEVLVHLSEDVIAKRGVEALESRAAQMRDEQRAYQEAYAAKTGE